MHDAEIIIIGAGIAGASAAYFLAGDAEVLLIEAEEQPGYHSTGRSAAFFFEYYGGPKLQPLSRASRKFFFDPPTGFADTSLIAPRGTLYIARQDQLSALEAYETDARAFIQVERLSSDQVLARVSLLDGDYVAAGLFERDCFDIDVATLHAAYLRGAASAATRLVCGARVDGISRTDDGWQVDVGEGSYRAPKLVNAAGAWADEIAKMAGCHPVGMSPLRRTMIKVELAEHEVHPGWPLVVDMDEEFYFKPEGQGVLISPADESLTLPCDAQPEDIDVATAAYRFEQATGIAVRNISNKWAGLRTFSPDRVPVFGPDPKFPSFFWCAGQGGYGIQTSPAAGALMRAAILGEDLPEHLVGAGVKAATYSPSRFVE